METTTQSVFTHDGLSHCREFLFLNIHHTNLEKHVLKSIFSGGSTSAYAEQLMLRLSATFSDEGECPAAEPFLGKKKVAGREKGRLLWRSQHLK